MTSARRWLAVGLLAALALGTAAPALAALEVKNTSTYVGGGRWDWTIFLDTDPATLQRIECVEYTMHPTFPNPVRRVCNQPQTKFAYSTNGWGTFTVQVRILYLDGKSEQRAHPLVFTQAPAEAIPSLTARNWAREIEPEWWEWGLHLDGADRDLDKVRCVEYTLHPTFPNPVRMVCSRADKFQLTARGWGTFTVKIRVLYRDGSVQTLNHALKFR